MNKLLVICGPTAMGKTKLAVSIAKRLNGELISADSRQVYRHLDIGTGKDFGISPRILQKYPVSYKTHQYMLPVYDLGGVPVWMYDVVNPDCEFSVSHYYHLTTDVIHNVISHNHLPILVGGTGFYIDSILHPPQTIDVPMMADLRKQLSKLTVEQLQNTLKDSDEEVFTSLNNSDKNNPRRLIRKIEIAKQEKDTVHPNTELPGDVLMIGLTAPQYMLSEAIHKRIRQRVAAGLLEEIQRVLDMGYTWTLPSLNTLGYIQWKEFIESYSKDKKQMYKNVLQQWEKDEESYAKRQLTWFKKRKEITWYDTTNPSFLADVTKSILSWYT